MKQQFFSIYGLRAERKKQPKILNIGNFSRFIDYNPIRRKQEAIPYKVRSQVLKDHNYKCDFCGRTVTLQQHHIVSRRIGDQSPMNFRLLCTHCHQGFRHRKLVDWGWAYAQGIGYSPETTAKLKGEITEIRRLNKIFRGT